MMVSYDEFRAAMLRSDDPEDKERNKALVERYPFLLPRYEWSQEPLDDYDYEFTNLDDIPQGWVKSFGIQMCEELRDILIEGNYLDDFRILQWKEKFGRLRIYSNGIPEKISNKYYAWEHKYEKLSGETCYSCGKPGHLMKTGWILPYCEKCFLKNYPKREYEKWRFG
jgi:hypothetical protein